MKSDGKMQITIEGVKRTNGNNKHQWPILQAFSDQLLWPVNGAMVKITAEEWKTILTAAYRQESPRVAQGLDGGMVLLGHRTREFKKEEWPDWITFLESVAADREVKIPVSKKQAAAMGCYE
ncbi:MAG: recombination protein NinB [Pseudomonadota bacterium]|nr:recombination protein NinB [Pseudomonadota bacterium]